MKLLFVVDEYPFPPRNGVTLPIANFIERLSSEGFLVDVLWFDLGTFEGNSVRVSKAVRELIRVPMKRRSTLTGVAMECLGISPLFAKWMPVEPLGFSGERIYDVIWASPIRAFGLWRQQGASLGLAGRRTWAVVNDSYTLTLRELAARKRSLLLRLLYRARALGMRRIEPRLLAHADLVGVQSEQEIQFFREVYGKRQGPRLVELKNGVSDGFFSPRREMQQDLLFVGTLDDFYRPMLNWFLEEVYARLPDPKPVFTVVGRGANAQDRAGFRRLGIVYHEFVENIGEEYLSSRILVAPIFKGYGTINKVIEGMAAGCVVIGDPTAFNGIGGFVSGKHGIVATDASGFVDAIQMVLADRELEREIGACARALMKKDFSWASRVDLIHDLLIGKDG